MSDEELLRAFESGALRELSHQTHVRMALLYLGRYDREEAFQLVTKGLKRFVADKGVPEKFHVTMTLAWLELLESARRLSPTADDPEAIVRAFPELLERDALSHFYSRDEIWSDAARNGWHTPDLAPRIDAKLLPSQRKEKAS